MPDTPPPNNGPAPAGDMPEPIITRKKRLTSIWLLPLVVALVGGWLVFQNYANKGPEITILFDSGEGITPGKTPIKFKGVDVGMVSDVVLTENRKKVAVTAEIKKSSEALAKTHSKFWLVKPRVSAAGVTGVETLLSGMYIAVQPGGGEPATRFTALQDSPVLDKKDDDLVVVLSAARLGSISPSCPVYYRQVQVGLVGQTRLSKQADKVLAFVRIKRNYAPLVRNNTVFWNVSGVGVDLGLFGSKIKTESLSAMLTGGVAFATPGGDALGAPAKRGAVFTLHDDPEDEWMEWAPKIPIDPEPDG